MPYAGRPTAWERLASRKQVHGHVHCARWVVLEYIDLCCRKARYPFSENWRYGLQHHLPPALICYGAKSRLSTSSSSYGVVEPFCCSQVRGTSGLGIHTHRRPKAARQAHHRLRVRPSALCHQPVTPRTPSLLVAELKSSQTCWPRSQRRQMSCARQKHGVGHYLARSHDCEVAPTPPRSLARLTG